MSLKFLILKQQELSGDIFNRVKKLKKIEQKKKKKHVCSKIFNN